MDYDLVDSGKPPGSSDSGEETKKQRRYKRSPTPFVSTSASASYAVSPTKMMINAAPPKTGYLYNPDPSAMPTPVQLGSPHFFISPSAPSTVAGPPPPADISGSGSEEKSAGSEKEKILETLLAALADLVRRKEEEPEQKPEKPDLSPATTGYSVAQIPVVGQRLNDLGVENTLTKFGGKISNAMFPRRARQMGPGGGSGAGWDSSKWMSGGSSWTSGQGKI